MNILIRKVVSFAIDNNKNVIISDCDNNLVGEQQGRVIKINESGKMELIFETNMRLKSPVIGKEGFIYVTTTDITDKLFCLFSDGKLKWEYEFNRRFPYIHSKPVIDKEGNIYICACNDEKGAMYSINKEGILNWQYKCNAVISCEPIIAYTEIIYLVLSMHSLCGIDKRGRRIYSKKLDGGMGMYPFNIRNDGTIFICPSNILYALDPNGNEKWSYKPEEGNVLHSPSLDHEGNLYTNLSNFRLVSLSGEGKEQWIAKIKGSAVNPPIMCCNGMLYQQSFLPNKSQYTSWIEVFSKNGEKQWEYEMKGDIISSALTDDSIYILTNCHSKIKNIRDGKDNVKWQLHKLVMRK